MVRVLSKEIKGKIRAPEALSITNKREVIPIYLTVEFWKDS